MTIETEIARVQYIAAAGTTVFSIPFVFDKTSDISVWMTLSGADPDPVADLLPSSSYVVSGSGFETPSGQRFITLDSTAFPTGAADGSTWTIERTMPYTRSTDFKVKGNFTSSNLDEEFDRAFAAVQQLNMKMEKLSVLYADNEILDSAGGDNRLPKLSANTGAGIPVWTTNSSGELIEGTIAESAGCSTLRSELASQVSGADGAGSVGFYDTVAAEGKTVRQIITELQSASPSSSFPVGFMGGYGGTTAPTGWVICDGGTIGNAASNATNRANSDTQSLFEFIWDSTSSDPEWAILYDSAGNSVSRGTSASADFASNHAISLPQAPGRAWGIKGQASISKTVTNVDTATDQLTIDSTGLFAFGIPITIASTATLPNPLVASTTYYVGIASSTEIVLYANEQDAVTGTAASRIDITTAGTGTITITYAQTDRKMFEYGGHESVLLDTDNMPEHDHTFSHSSGSGSVPGSGGSAPNYTSPTHTEGGSTSFSSLPPTLYTNMIMKL